MPDGGAFALAYPIPDEALDDRLGFWGTMGSGKSYNAAGAIQRIETKKRRTITFDPLGVHWGRRLLADGVTPSAFKPVILGGPHGDLPINEHSGALIGEAIAAASQSIIIDLSDFPSKAAERRFMLACLTVLYRKANREPVHLVFDEADMWAPQKINDKDGDASKLLGMMETICRRGRIKGFIPWLITQRPAVLSKDVLSQVDGLAAFKLTAKQDRDAVNDWMLYAADKAEGKEILGSLAGKQIGEAVLWLPARGILQHVAFPELRTFDSFRTPKHGEHAPSIALKPLDLGKLRDKLATVEAEQKANDPRALKAEVARLTNELAKAGSKKAAPAAPAPPPAPAVDIPAIQAAAYATGVRNGYPAGYVDGFVKAGEDALASVGKISMHGKTPAPAPALLSGGEGLPVPKGAIKAARPAPPMIQKPVTNEAAKRITPSAEAAADLGQGHMRILEALAFWEGIGITAPSRDQTAAAASFANGGTFSTYVSKLNTGGFVTAERGTLSLTDSGRDTAPLIDMSVSVRARLERLLGAGHAKILDALPKDGTPMTRDELAAASGFANGGTFSTYLSKLNSMGLTVSERGTVSVSDWVWS